MGVGLEWFFGPWWGMALSVNLMTVALGLFPHRQATLSSSCPPLSVIVPVKGADPVIAENLRALFDQDYRSYEIVFALADANDPAIPLLEEIISEHREVPARLTTEQISPSGNPKLDNLRRGLLLIRHELVLFCDVNARLRRDELRRLSAQLGNGVGLLTSVPVAVEPHGFCAQIEAAFFNGGGARWLIAADRVGYGVGVGQTMLLRRTDLERFGGVHAMALGACEDAALATAIRRTGLAVRMARDPGWHPIGRRRFIDLWRRHLRWQCCRKYHALPLFAFEPAVSPLAVALVGGIWWGQLTGLPALPLVAAHLGLWLAIEALYLRLKGWHLSWLSPLAWLAREALIPALWLKALVARTLIWRDQQIKLPSILALYRQK
jgi:ceramide glucosyltransferase